jgi:hypothetical protein
MFEVPRFFGLASELETAKRVSFPEINPGTEPVVIVAALLEGFALQYALANGLITPVVAENETRSQLMQRGLGNAWLPVVFGKFSGFRIDPRLNQHPHC